VYATAHEQMSGKVQFCVAQKNRRGSEYRATLENAIHMVDLLRWFCGEAESVSASAIAPDPYQEDGAAALIRFDSGALGLLMAARSAGEWDERLDVYGGLTTARVTAPDALAIARDGETRLVEMRPRALGWAQVNTTLGFGPEVSHFVECVRERKRPRTDGHDAVRTQALTDEIIRLAGLPTHDRDEVRA
jgi:virulence factor